MGTNIYTNSVDEIMNILDTFAKTYKLNANAKKIEQQQDTVEVALMLKEEKIICHHCGKEDRIKKVCPMKGKDKEEDHIHTQLGDIHDKEEEEGKELGYIATNM